MFDFERIDDDQTPSGTSPQPDVEPRQNMEIMVFDDGSLSADKGQSSAMSLVINYAEPRFAAGTAVFGLNLLVLPLLAQVNALPNKDALADRKGVFAYQAHSEANPRLPMRIFTDSELKSRLGLLDSAFLLSEITMSTDELDEYLNECDTDVTDEEVTRIQKWRDKANTHLRSLQKRSALAFLGLPPDSGDAEVNKMYKKLALELHPDKGGDPEKFQELQDAKEKLTEIDKEEKDEEDPDDEEARKAKEKEKKEEDEESKKLPADERAKKLRMDVHDNTLRIWERAKKARDDITGEKALKANAQPALNILRHFVERFVANEVKTLRHDDSKGAEMKFRKFLKQGAEIIAVAALSDVQATLSTVAMHFNYKLVARSGSAAMKSRCAALLEAIAEVPQRAEAFLDEVEARLADQKERDLQRKTARAAAQRGREARGDFSGDQGGQSRPQPASTPAAGAPQAKGPGGVSQPPSAGYPKAAGAAKDPFADFAFDDGPKPAAKASKAAAPASTALRKKAEESSAIAAAQKPKRTCWDPEFDHPFAGALKTNGTGIYCRQCQRWIVTHEYCIEVFLTHVERAHPQK